MDDDLNYEMRKADRIYGEVIKSIQLGGDCVLYFTTERAVHVFEVGGDCCSHSYFYEINNVEQMLNATIIKIETIDMPNVEDEHQDKDAGYHDAIVAYGYKFHTDKGYGLIVFRNSSNGYYGGSMNYMGEVEFVPSAVTDITKDWNM